MTFASNGMSPNCVIDTLAVSEGPAGVGAGAGAGAGAAGTGVGTGDGVPVPDEPQPANSKHSRETDAVLTRMGNND